MILEKVWGPEDSRTFEENARESGGPADFADPIQEGENWKMNKRMQNYLGFHPDILRNYVADCNIYQS